MSNPDAIFGALSGALCGGGLRLAVLFGSRATGRATGNSDVDIGILPIAEMSMTDELALASTLSGLARAEVDLVRLDRENPLLALEVAQTGICLYEAHPGTFSSYRARAMSAWIDFDATWAPHRANKLKRLAAQ